MKVILPYTIGQYQILPQDHAIITSSRNKQILPAHSINILSHLVECYPESVSKEELMTKIWQGNEENIEQAFTNSIRELQQILNSTTDQQDILESSPKLTYRLLVKPQQRNIYNKGFAAGHSHVLNNMQRTWKDFIPHYIIVFAIVIGFGYFYQEKQKAISQDNEVIKQTIAPTNEQNNPTTNN